MLDTPRWHVKRHAALGKGWCVHAWQSHALSCCRAPTCPQPLSAPSHCMARPWKTGSGRALSCAGAGMLGGLARAYGEPAAALALAAALWAYVHPTSEQIARCVAALVPVMAGYAQTSGECAAGRYQDGLDMEQVTTAAAAAIFVGLLGSWLGWEWIQSAGDAWREGHNSTGGWAAAAAILALKCKRKWQCGIKPRKQGSAKCRAEQHSGLNSGGVGPCCRPGTEGTSGRHSGWPRCSPPSPPRPRSSLSWTPGTLSTSAWRWPSLGGPQEAGA